MSFIVDPLGSPITLRSPDFTDVISIKTHDIKRTTRSGDLNVYCHADWPIVKAFRYSFSRLTAATVTSLKTFLEANAGDEIKVTDHHGTTMDGFVVTPIYEVVNVRPDCSLSISFEFMETPS